MLLEIKKTLKDLGFREKEIKIYLALTSLGEAPASLVAKKVNLPRTTVISILDILETKGYLTTHKYRGVIYYWVESPEVIGDVFRNKASLAGGLKTLLSDLYKINANFPFAKVYDTKKSIVNFIEKSLLKTKKKSIIYTIDTPHEGNYKKIFSPEWEKIFFSIKQKKQFHTKTLVPHGTFAAIASYKIKQQSIEIREMPPEINFNSSFWIIGEAVYLFSGNPPFLVEINHQAIKKGLKALYDFLWNISRPAG